MLTDCLVGLCSVAAPLQRGLPIRSVTAVGFGCRPRGTVRGTTRRIIPAQLVALVRLPVPSVQLGRAAHEHTSCKRLAVVELGVITDGPAPEQSVAMT